MCKRGRIRLQIDQACGQVASARWGNVVSWFTNLLQFLFPGRKAQARAQAEQCVAREQEAYDALWNQLTALERELQDLRARELQDLRARPVRN